MTLTTINPTEVAERGEAIYRDRIKALVKTPENIGKMLIIDTETGDYEVGDRNGMEAAEKMLEAHSALNLYWIRIGYTTAEAIGNVLQLDETS